MKMKSPHPPLSSLASAFTFLIAAMPVLAAPSGVVMDDDAGQYTGTWTVSEKQAPLLGKAYRHDTNRHQGASRVRFTPTLPQSGEYEVRLLYVATSNRATMVPVTVVSASGSQTIAVNQREEALQGGVPRALGVFRFEKGSSSYVELSNEGADGFVVIDGVQWVPVEVATAERAGKADAGFSGKRSAPPQSAGAEEKRQQLAARVAVSPLAPQTAPRKSPVAPDTEPVALAKDAAASEVDGKSYDVIVVGATAGGTACAVRAAREGCTVLLVQHNRHIGGMMSNGLMQWDALYGGPRAPLFTELLGKIEQHYISRFGKDSPDHQTMRYTHEHYPIGWAEPRVNEREFNRLVAREKNITLLLSHYPVSVAMSESRIHGLTLRAYGTQRDIRVSGQVFVDGTYEGDLMALAKAPFRVGREARHEFNEPHAGKVYVNIDHSTSAPQAAVNAELNIRPYNSRQGSVDPASPFSADGAVQAYNYRFCVTRDPGNRILLTEPPPGYNREEYVHYDRKSISTNAGPNSKSHMNSPILPGENHAYPEADWPTRERIIERHRNFALGLIWFLQNDESVSASRRAQFREWGLPKDEFADHGHIPYEMYVREARRLVGRHVLTELDGMLVSSYGRTPIQPDSIATTDWYQDSHSCTMDSRPGYRYDGKLILTEESRPAQIPYRSLLPPNVDNLLVPVCLSATHVMWGAIRLEPVWMQTGEAAGFAAAMSVKTKTAPANLDSVKLVRKLAENQFLVSFFNDIKVTGEEKWIPAVQYFATQGFFHTFDANAGASLDNTTAALWLDAFYSMACQAMALPSEGPGRLPGTKPPHHPRVLAANLAASKPDSSALTLEDFLRKLEFPRPVTDMDRGLLTEAKVDPGETFSRGVACHILYTLLQRLERDFGRRPSL